MPGVTASGRVVQPLSLEADLPIDYLNGRRKFGATLSFGDTAMEHVFLEITLRAITLRRPRGGWCGHQSQSHWIVNCSGFYPA